METSTNTKGKRYQDEDSSDCESIGSSSVNSQIMSTTKWYNRGGSHPLRSLIGLPKKNSPGVLAGEKPPRSIWWRTTVIILAVLCFFAVIGWITYISLVHALVRKLRPPNIPGGLQHIVENWKEPTADGSYQYTWREDFSNNILPKSCHSHNDYWRSVPLYEALSLGCVGVEADVWLTEDKQDLLVAHSWKSTTPYRTLKSLYLDPLSNILRNRNVSRASMEPRETGIFEADPNAAVILLIDFKQDGHETWPLVHSQLQPFYKSGWLTHFNGSDVVPGPVTVVGTGNTPFDLVTANNTSRYIFFDAPLTDVSNPKYTTENSYYASTSLKSLIGYTWLNRLSGKQVDTIKDRIQAAAAKGLKSRFWNTPTWPISLRDKVWFTLMENGVGMLSVDELWSATRWNWNWCVVAGLSLCGTS